MICYCVTLSDINLLVLEKVSPHSASVTSTSEVTTLRRYRNMTILLLLPTPTMSVGVGRIFESVCLFVCPEHNSKTNDPKVFKLQTWYRE